MVKQHQLRRPQAKLLKPTPQFRDGRLIGHYHTLTQFENRGVSAFVESARQYLRSWRNIPVARTFSSAGHFVYFTFVTALLEETATNTSLQKAVEIALKYGFLGFSRGGRNGIFYQRKQDRELAAATTRLLADAAGEVSLDLDISESEFEQLRLIKLVQHDGTGRRLVGVLNEKNHRLIFIGFAKY